ncbi:MAG: PQQ-binding-like beta-propeller repeat protein [Phycisphaerales bacterium]|nr:MAG: PQQ-binding-like beta-propeller repeat protein [Phycisphaerales bacterium]
MIRVHSLGISVLVGTCLVALPAVTAATQADWPQWGGPARNFVAESTGLAHAWPEDGPPRLWTRQLGDGFASVVVDSGVLYTMYRKDKSEDHEYAIALDAATGKTIWEQKAPSPLPDDERQFPGPHATPLVCGEYVFTVGRNAVLRCWDKHSGRLHWQHDLVAEFGAFVPVWGYASSPIAYGDTVIVLVGAQKYDSRERADESLAVAAAVPMEKRASLLAFSQSSGSVVWKQHNLRTKYTSPILIQRDGKDQLLITPLRGIMGIDPVGGDLLWEYPIPGEAHVMTPLMVDRDTLFCASTRTGRLFKFAPQGQVPTLEKLWESKKLGVHVSTPVLYEDVFVISKGGEQGSLLVGADPETGKRIWTHRGLAEAKMIHAGDKTIMLDERGRLVMAEATIQGLTILSQWQLPEWSGEIHCVPTLVDKTLYVRDRTQLIALDLG